MDTRTATFKIYCRDYLQVDVRQMKVKKIQNLRSNNPLSLVIILSTTMCHMCLMIDLLSKNSTMSVWPLAACTFGDFWESEKKLFQIVSSMTAVEYMHSCTIQQYLACALF